jgi:hypothetical protein
LLVWCGIEQNSEKRFFVGVARTQLFG